MRLLLVCLASLLLFTACGIYQMPTADHLHTVPRTNNAALIRDRNDGMLPQLNY